MIAVLFWAVARVKCYAASEHDHLADNALGESGPKSCFGYSNRELLNQSELHFPLLCACDPLQTLRCRLYYEVTNIEEREKISTRADSDSRLFPRMMDRFITWNKPSPTLRDFSTKQIRFTSWGGSGVADNCQYLCSCNFSITDLFWRMSSTSTHSRCRTFQDILEVNGSEKYITQCAVGRCSQKYPQRCAAQVATYSPCKPDSLASRPSVTVSTTPILASVYSNPSRKAHMQQGPCNLWVCL